MSDYSQCLEEYGSIKRTPSVHSIDSIHMQRNNHRSADISMQLHKNGNLFNQPLKWCCVVLQQPQLLNVALKLQKRSATFIIGHKKQQQFIAHSIWFCILCNSIYCTFYILLSGTNNSKWFISRLQCKANSIYILICDKKNVQLISKWKLFILSIFSSLFLLSHFSVLVLKTLSTQLNSVTGNIKSNNKMRPFQIT